MGVGKTEVALRAAFKCVMGGKQCAILAPTTLLAWQHYNTILSRMEAFPVHAELLSRFRTPKQQKEALRGLQAGSVDIVVGTHRLLSKDVRFHDLGLVIIDEEQRFGVRHKEKLKQNFIGVDMLTLSATPIPRTLSMAMSGIRDMSTIEEPPFERQPVETFVLEYNEVILAEAIRKELARGGQVYYLHNRVDNIEATAARVQQMAPSARVGIAHGKMTEEELNPVWQKLLNGELDILVCTTLIETGIDVRNCNTLIIEDADRMGLAQLYQLRGRVGRSGRKAYAYFTFRRDKTLSDIAQKRLSAIREFTAFGSGFRIAMRDLQIRGAGNLLGHSQHGHMEAVGYDLYMKMLNQAIAQARGEPIQRDKSECLVDLRVDAYIPERYIPDGPGRIEAYRRIAAIQNAADAADVLDELIDRYGDPPASVSDLVNVSLVRVQAAQVGVYEVTQKKDLLTLSLEKLELPMIRGLLTALQRPGDGGRRGQTLSVGEAPARRKAPGPAEPAAPGHGRHSGQKHRLCAPKRLTYPARRGYTGGLSDPPVPKSSKEHTAMKQKLLALAAVLALCFSLAGCTISTPDTVGTIGGQEISSGTYLLAQFDAYQQAAQYAGEDQDPSNVKSFLKETITPDGGDSITVSDFVAQTTQEDLQRYVAVENRFSELAGDLSEDYTSQADSYTDQLMDSYGDLYKSNGIGEDTIRQYEYNLAKQAALVNLIYGPDGETPLTMTSSPTIWKTRCSTSAITVPLYNTSTYAFADEDQTSQMLQLAQDAAAASTPDTFDDTVAAALPDIYAVLDSELSAEDAASQLSSSFLSQDQLDSSFSEEDAATLRGLQYGDACAVTYSSTSILIAMRLDPLDTMSLDLLRSTVLSDMATPMVDADMKEAGAALETNLDQSAMAKLPASKIKMN